MSTPIQSADKRASLRITCQLRSGSSRSERRSGTMLNRRTSRSRSVTRRCASDTADEAEAPLSGARSWRSTAAISGARTAITGSVVGATRAWPAAYSSSASRWNPSRKTLTNASGSSITSARARPRPCASGSRCATSACARAVVSDVKVLDLARARLDEVATRLDLFAHQRREDHVGLRRILDVGAQQRACGRVHRGFPELFGIHLTQAFEALNGEVLHLQLLDDTVLVLLVARVASELARTDAEEWRLGDVQMAVLDESRHVAVEERHQQSADMRAVHVRVGEQDDLVIAQLADVEGLTDAGAQGDDERPDLLR